MCQRGNMANQANGDVEMPAEKQQEMLTQPEKSDNNTAESEKNIRQMKATLNSAGIRNTKAEEGFYRVRTWNKIGC